jgi:hypothetical protein
LAVRQAKDFGEIGERLSPQVEDIGRRCNSHRLATERSASSSSRGAPAPSPAHDANGRRWLGE